jgi:F-type H+-transporting ATPase subunit delta
MFIPERWAEAFASALAKNPAEDAASVERGLAALKAILPLVQAIPGLTGGFSSARRLEKMLLDAEKSAGLSGKEYGITACFIALLVERGFLRRAAAVIRAVERILDTQKGIVAVGVESAFPLDGEFLEALKEKIMRRTGAAGVKLETKIDPGLLGGCRLRMGGELLDASLRSQMQKMTEYLQSSGGSEW